MLWYITYNRIEIEVPFLLYDKFFTLVRVTAHGITIRPGQNLSTKPLDVSLLAFHTSATMVESSAYLKRAGVEPSLISRSFKNTLNKWGPLKLPFVVPLFTPFHS